MDAQKLQESPSATFLHPDDDGLREFFAAKIIGYRNIVGRGVTVRQVRQLFADKRDRRRVIRAELLRFLSIFKENFGLEITSLVIHGSGQGFAVTVEAVKEVNEENNHGKEDRQLGVHLQVSKVERSSPFTTSHGSQSWARGHDAGNMPYQGGWILKSKWQQLKKRLFCATCPSGAKLVHRASKSSTCSLLSLSPPVTVPESCSHQNKTNKQNKVSLTTGAKIHKIKTQIQQVEKHQPHSSPCLLCAPAAPWQRLCRKPSAILSVWLPNPRPVYQAHAPFQSSARATLKIQRKIITRARRVPSPLRSDREEKTLISRYFESNFREIW